MNSIEENTLPKEWRLGQLKNYLSIQNGYAFNSKKFTDTSDGIPLIRIRNLKESTLTTFYTGDYDDKFIVRKGDFLIGMDGEFRCYEWRNEDALLNQRVCRIVDVNEQLDSRFLFYGINKYLKDIEDVTSFVTVKHISSKQIKEINFPLPPLEEQKRIVAKIDTLFSKIDKAISLTEESLKQAQNLLPSILKEVFENCEGETMTLNKVSEIQPKKNQVKNLDCEVSFVPMKFLNEKKIDFVPESDRNISEVYKGYTYFQDGDVLLAKVIPCFQNGKSGVAKGLTNGIGFGSSEFIVFRPYDFILQEWLYYNISSPDFLFEGNNNMSGAVGLKRLTKSFVSEWKIKVPDLKTQKTFIDRINKVSNQSKKTQSKLEKQLAYLKQLKSSILSKEFKGEL